MSVWIFEKFRVYLWKMLLESKALLSNNFFHTNLLSFFKIQPCHKISFFDARDFKLGYFDVSDMLFPFLAFLKLQPIISWKVGHVMAFLNISNSKRCDHNQNKQTEFSLWDLPCSGSESILLWSAKRRTRWFWESLKCTSNWVCLTRNEFWEFSYIWESDTNQGIFRIINFIRANTTYLKLN